eukprot:m.225409 g.225409  ORF g.225409 m.225409 type:complete len:375 (+) comp11260_c0_seq1:38-1162(+)
MKNNKNRQRTLGNITTSLLLLLCARDLLANVTRGRARGLGLRQHLPEQLADILEARPLVTIHMPAHGCNTEDVLIGTLRTLESQALAHAPLDVLVAHILVRGGTIAEDLPEEHAVRPDVTALGEDLVVESLDRDPLDGQLRRHPQHVVVLALVQRPGQTEVGNLAHVAGVQQTVAGGKIHVDETVLSHVCHAIGNLDRVDQLLEARQGNALLLAGLQHIAHIAVLHALEHAEPGPLLHGNADHADEILVCQAGHRLRLTQELALVRDRGAVAQHLDGNHRLVVFEIPVGQINFTELAGTNGLDGLQVLAVHLLREERAADGLALGGRCRERIALLRGHRGGGGLERVADRHAHIVCARATVVEVAADTTETLVM